MGRKMASDVARIQIVRDAYGAAMHAGDLERWISLWADDAIQMPPDGPRNVGKEQIRKASRPGFELYQRSNMTAQVEETRILGDWAFTHGTYAFDLTPKAGGETMSFSGKFLDILRRQPDGSWKITVDCHNIMSTA